MNHPQSRRSFLEGVAAVPVLALGAGGGSRGVSQMICEPSCLSQESAAGFRSILGPGIDEQSRSRHPRVIVVLPAASAVTEERIRGLHERAVAGAWVVWENSPVYPSQVERQRQAGILAETFGLSFAGDGAVATNAGLYVQYSWPRATLTRTFLAAVPVRCAAEEAIAHYGGVPVGAIRRTGRGGIILLGSMLGPQVRAAEREATRLATEMFTGLPG